MKNTFLVFLCLFSFSFACSNNDKLISPDHATPIMLSLDSLKLSDSAIAALNVDDFLISDTVAEFQLTVRCMLLDNGASIQTVQVSLAKSGTETAISTAFLDLLQSQQDTLIYEGSLPVLLPRTDIGLYTIYAFAESAEETFSQSIQRQIQLFKNNAVPHIDTVMFSADTIRVDSPPYSDILFVMASVSDPDGLSDIAQVEAIFEPFTFEMFDDGNVVEHGDKFYGDGVYTRGFSVDSSNTSGLRTFLFRAIDSSGDTSQVKTGSFYIQSKN